MSNARSLRSISQGVARCDGEQEQFLFSGRTLGASGGLLTSRFGTNEATAEGNLVARKAPGQTVCSATCQTVPVWRVRDKIQYITFGPSS